MTTPWTQTLSVRWRPELRFYEQRIGILRSLEDQGVLKAFAVAEDHIGARVLDAGHQITVRQDGLSLDLVGQDADIEAVWRFAKVAVERLAPTRLRDGTARFAHVAALDVSFGEAIARSTEHLFNPSSATGAACADYALLMDLTAPDNVSAKVEFGIIRGAEARPRLNGLGKRIGPVSRVLTEYDWSARKFPDVALFADSLWRRAVLGEDGKFEDARGFWADATEHAAQFVDAVQERIDTDCYKRGMGST